MQAPRYMYYAFPALTAINPRADCERSVMSRPDREDVEKLRRLHSIYKLGWMQVICAWDTRVSYRDTAAFCISGVGAAVMSLTTSAISSLGFCIISSFNEFWVANEVKVQVREDSWRYLNIPTTVTVAECVTALSLRHRHITRGINTWKNDCRKIRWDPGYPTTTNDQVLRHPSCWNRYRLICIMQEALLYKAI